MSLHGSSPSQAGDAEAKSGTSFGEAVAVTEARNAKMVDEELSRSYEVDAGAGVAEAKDSGVGGIESKMGNVGVGNSGPDTPTNKGVDSPTVDVEAAAESKVEAASAGAQSPERTVQPRKSPAKAVEDETVASPTTREVGASEAKADMEERRGSTKQSLGAFHHLAPMRKPSGLENKLGDIRKSMGGGGGLGPIGGAAPWDPGGKPVLGKKGGGLDAKPL